LSTGSELDRWSYSKAGVDIEKQKEMQKEFITIIKRKAKGIGGYASSFKLGENEITLHVDGVGTKTILLDQLDKNWVAGWDCVMVNANDIACEGFRGLLVVDYLAVERANPKLSEEIAKGLARAVDETNITLAGGETAIMPDVIKGYDISCSLLGIREALPEVPRAGDVIIAVESTGPHANGYTLIRKLIDSGLLDLKELPEVTNPVANYHNALLSAMKSGTAKWAAHVTGGAFMKVHERLPPNLGVELDCWDIPKVFLKIVEAGKLDPYEAFRTFNMGIGLLIVGSDEVIEYFEKEGMKAWVAGRVVAGSSKICTPWGTVVVK